MKKSKIFTRAELEEMERREKGDRNDKTGIFSLRIRPKIIELLDIWFPKKKALRTSVERRGKEK